MEPESPADAPIWVIEPHRRGPVIGNDSVRITADRCRKLNGHAAVDAWVFAHGNGGFGAVGRRGQRPVTEFRAHGRAVVGRNPAEERRRQEGDEQYTDAEFQGLPDDRRESPVGGVVV